MENKKEVLHARISKETKEQLEMIAKHNKRSLTNMLEILIQSAYEEIKKEQP